MSTCPFCQAKLSEIDQAALKCPTCGHALEHAQDVGQPAAPPPGAGTIDARVIAQTIDPSMLAGAHDSASLERAGEGGKTLDQRHLAQTIDPSAFPLISPSEEVPPASPVFAQTIDPSALPFGMTSGAPPSAMDSGSAQTIDPSAMPFEPGKGPSTFDQRRLAQTIDPGDLPSEDVGRMTAMWADALEPESKPHMTVKGQSKGGAVPGGSLVIQARALRKGGETHATPSDYELIEVLGEGGMGVVYTARQASIDRTVAIKMVKSAIATDQEQRNKFLAEAVVTGDLEHPNIVPIYDLGTNETGALFYSMKKVQGTPWMKVIRAKSLQENLEILMKVADAVAFAHSRGVVHRDLKPENIMLGGFGEVLVMDWGLALLSETSSKTGGVRQAGGMGGTPAYMAPEMASGPFDNIGPGSDIYLLGAILFEIVTGNPPHTGKSTIHCLFAAGKNEIVSTEKSGELVDIALKAMTTRIEDRHPSVLAFQDALRLYQAHSESIALSTRAEEELEEARGTSDYQGFSRAVFGFEESLVLWSGNIRAKSNLAVAKLAYAESATSKGDFDLAASLLDSSEPEHAALGEKIKAAQREREARQHRLKNAKRIAVGLVATIMIVVTGAFFWIRAEAARALAAEKNALAAEKVASKERDTAQKQRDIAEEQRTIADQQRAEALLAQAEADKRRKEAEVAKTQAEKARAKEEIARNNAVIAEKAAVAAKKVAEDEKKKAEDARELAVKAEKAEQYAAYIARIGLASAKIDENSFDKAFELLEECKPELRNWEWGRLMHLCGQSFHTFQADGPVDAVAFSPDGERFITGSWDGLARIWSVEPGNVLVTIPYGGLYVQAVAFSSDGKYVATGGNDTNGFVKLWNAETGARVQTTFKGHEDAVLSVAFSKDGRRLLTSSYDNTARLWDVATGRELEVYRGHNWWVWSAAFSPDEKRIVTASQDGTAIVWTVGSKDKTALPLFTGHTGPVYSAAFSPDGGQVATAGYDKRVLIWNVDEVKPFDYQKVVSDEEVTPQPYRALEGHNAPVRSVRFSPGDGRLVVSGSQDNTVTVWDVASGKVLKMLRGHAGSVRSCVFSPSGHEVLSGSHDQQVKLWSIAGYEEVRVLQGRVFEGHSDAVLAAAFSPDGQRIVTASRDRTARTWAFATGEELKRFEEGHEFLASSAAFYPDSKKLLTAAVDNTVRSWDVSTGTQVFSLEQAGRSAAVAVSHDARWILTGGEEIGQENGKEKKVKLVKLWDAESGTLIRTLKNHVADVTAVAFSPDDRTIFTGDTNGRCWVWNAATGEALRHFDGHSRRINAVCFTPDGKRVLTASADNTVGQWDLDAGKEIVSKVLKHPDAVMSMGLSPDGRLAVTSAEDGKVRVWDVDRAALLGTLDDPGTMVNAVAVSPDGAMALTASTKDRTVRLWDLKSRKEISAAKNARQDGAFLKLGEGGGVVWSAIFSPDGQYVLTVGGNGGRLWDIETGQERITFNPHGAVASVSFSHDGRRIVTGSWDNSAKIWDSETAKAQLKLTGEHTGFVNSAVFSPDDSQVLTCSDDKTAILWDATTAKAIATFAGHTDRVRWAVFSTDGTRVLTASNDKTARLWDVNTRQELRAFKGHVWSVLSTAFSKEGDRVITGSEDNTAKIWNAATGEEILSLEGHTAPVNSVVFAPDGRRVLTGSRDNTAKLWDAATGKEVLTLKGHSQEVTSVAFSADGQFALTGSRDGTSIMWLTVGWKDKATATAGR